MNLEVDSKDEVMHI